MYGECSNVIIMIELLDHLIYYQQQHGADCFEIVEAISDLVGPSTITPSPTRLHKRVQKIAYLFVQPLEVDMRFKTVDRSFCIIFQRSVMKSSQHCFLRRLCSREARVAETGSLLRCRNHQASPTLGRTW